MGRVIPATYSSALETVGKSHSSINICDDDSSENKLGCNRPGWCIQLFNINYYLTCFMLFSLIRWKFLWGNNLVPVSKYLWNQRPSHLSLRKESWDVSDWQWSKVDKSQEQNFCRIEHGSIHELLKTSLRTQGLSLQESWDIRDHLGDGAVNWRNAGGEPLASLKYWRCCN